MINSNQLQQVGPHQKAVIVKIIIQIQTTAAKSVTVSCFQKMIVVQNILDETPKVTG